MLQHARVLVLPPRRSIKTVFSQAEVLAPKDLSSSLPGPAKIYTRIQTTKSALACLLQVKAPEQQAVRFPSVRLRPPKSYLKRFLCWVIGHCLHHQVYVSSSSL